MNGRRGILHSTAEDCGESETCKLSRRRVNRLRRSPRPTQPQPEPERAPCDTDNTRAGSGFITPTRPPKSRFRSSVHDESPNNEAECQQDIIWDSTSPSTPLRNGRGRRRTAHLKSVDISDIVNRIAPTSRRLEEAESCLLQWIGDSVISCTPEVREPRTKPKSTRQNDVDDLLKLAQQFDLNMIQQKENYLNPTEQHFQETIDEDQDLFCDVDDQPAPRITHCSPDTSVRALQGLDGCLMNGEDALDDLALIQEMEDDLDLLFDGPTQQVSGRLSGSSQDGAKAAQRSVVKGSLAAGQGRDSVAGTVQVSVMAAPCNSKYGCLASEAGGSSEPGSTRMSAAAGAPYNSKQAPISTDFNDDWGNDDLLEDSLLSEMTQNPELFSEPQHSSTQKQTITGVGGSFFTNANGNKVGGAYHQQDKQDVNCGSFQAPNQRLKSAQSFQMSSLSEHQRTGGSRVAPSYKNVSRNETTAKNDQQRNVLPSNKAPLEAPRFSNNQYQFSVSNAKTQHQEPIGVQSGSSGTAGVSSTWRVQAVTKTSLVSSISGSSRFVPKAPPNFRLHEDTEVTTEKENLQTAAVDGLSDIADEELDSIFASDDIWDDGADDDDLFCEACENVEEFTPGPKAFPEASATKATTENKRVQSGTLSTSGREKGPGATANMYQSKWESVHPPKPNIPNYTMNASTNQSASSTHTQMPTHGTRALNCTTTSVRSPAANMASGTSYKGQYKFAQVKSTLVTVCAPYSAGPQQQISVPCQRASDDHQFKKPYSTFSAAHVISKDVGRPTVGRCSDAEIEQKKQQAMERRRLRMLASQNLRTST